MSSGRKSPFLFDRRALLKGALTCGSLHAVLRPATVCAASLPAIDATFVFTSDIHACRMGSGLSPQCAAEGKTDANLRRHIAAINRLPEMRWPREIGAAPTGLASAGAMIGKPFGVVIGGDMTDDGGGQVDASRRRHAAPAVQPSLSGGARAPTGFISPSMSASATTTSTRTARHSRSTGTGANCATMSSSTTARA